MLNGIGSEEIGGGLSWDKVLNWDEPWHVIHVRSRTEKVVRSKAEQLQDEGMVCLLPTWTRRQKYQRRLVETHLPLFPGYLFVRAKTELIDDFSWRTREIVSCLKVWDQEAFSTSIDAVKTMLDNSENVRPEPSVSCGMDVEIISGPLVGLRGKVIGELKSLRFILAIDMIQLGASVEVDEAMIEPLA